jgi:hypothetical protein
MSVQTILSRKEKMSVKIGKRFNKHFKAGKRK